MPTFLVNMVFFKAFYIFVFLKTLNLSLFSSCLLYQLLPFSKKLSVPRRPLMFSYLTHKAQSMFVCVCVHTFYYLAEQMQIYNIPNIY